MKSVFTFGDFQLDAEEQILRRSAAETIALKPRIFQLLLIFVRSGNRILTKKDFMRELWSNLFVDEHNLAVNVHLLRQILGDTSKDPSFIETIPRRGYRFIPEVSEIAASSAAAENKTVLQNTDSSVGEPAAHSEAATSTIALLSFNTISSVRSDEYLGIGISHTLTARLGGLGKIVSCPKETIFKFGGRNYDLQTVGEKLNADFVIDGSVRKIGKRLRVTAQIVRVGDGAVLRSEIFDDEFKNILEIEDEIARQIAETLLNLSGGDEKSPVQRPTDNTEAYQYYLKGRYCLDKRSVGEFEKAVGYFKKAIEKDAGYALAYAGLADAYNLLISYGLIPLEESIEKIKAATSKALELDPFLAEPHATLGHLKIFQFLQFAEAEKDLQKAIRLNPNYTNARLWYALLHRIIGRMEESLNELRRAQEIEPLSFVVNTAIGAHYYFTRRYEDAIKQLREVIKLDENYSGAQFFVAQSLERLQKYSEAVAHYEKTLACSNFDPEVTGYLAFTQARAGQKKHAKKLLAQLKKSTAERITNYSVVIALVYSALGDNDSAFEWLERGFQKRVIKITIINFEPKFDELRPDARFKILQQRLSTLLARNS